MKIATYLIIAIASIFIFIACQKEFSMESGFAGKVATGALLDTTDNCRNIKINGTYYADSTLSDSNYVVVQVNFATGGSYRIFTDMQNGFSFQDSGYIGPGIQSIKLKATGRPVATIPTNFQVAFDTTFCSFSVDVIGKIPATYTLVGAGGSCTNATVHGTYTTGVVLSTNNHLTLDLNVTSPGSYTITSATVGGMTFSGTGNFSTPGIKTITLQGTGTPTASGANNIPVTAGGTTCSFTVNVSPGSAGNFTPNNADTAWRFTQATNSFRGPFFDVFDTTRAGAGYGLVFIGYTRATQDTIFFMQILYPGGKIQTGTFNTNTPVAAFSYMDYRDTTNPVKIYTADNSTANANTSITVATYDTASKIITGTFTGTAVNRLNSPVPVTNGRFTARVR